MKNMLNCYVNLCTALSNSWWPLWLVFQLCSVYSWILYPYCLLTSPMTQQNAPQMLHKLLKQTCRLYSARALCFPLCLLCPPHLQWDDLKSTPKYWALLAQISTTLITSWHNINDGMVWINNAIKAGIKMPLFPEERRHLCTRGCYFASAMMCFIFALKWQCIHQNWMTPIKIECCSGKGRHSHRVLWPWWKHTWLVFLRTLQPTCS